jgi:hypothetical protein
VSEVLRLAYADPPYPGCAELYRDHPDFNGEVDHKRLIDRLEGEYDGWVLHTHIPGLRFMESRGWIPEGVRICAWFKSFAAFKRNVSVAYAWEPVIIKAARKPEVSKRIIYRDFIEVPDCIKEPITLKRGLAGAKPEKVCKWAFELMGADPRDRLERYVPRDRRCDERLEGVVIYVGGSGDATTNAVSILWSRRWYPT